MAVERVLMTGGSGLLGRALAPLLREQVEVIHFDLVDPGDGCDFIRGDLRDADQVACACRQVDAVIHAGALHGKTWQDAGDTMGFEVNVLGTRNILDAAAATGVDRVVFTSSIWATGHDAPPAPYLPIDEELPRLPRELYGLSKRLGEQMCDYTTENGGPSTIVLRPGGIRPPESYTPTTPGYLFGWVDVRDVAQAHVLALTAPMSCRHEVFVITAESLLCGVESDHYRRDPEGVLISLVPALEAPIRAGEFKPDPDAEWYSVAKAQDLLGYEPRYNVVGGEWTNEQR